ncbi:MAG TPA: lipid II flippase MurJ [Acidobacteriaceae bacterium]
MTLSSPDAPSASAPIASIPSPAANKSHTRTHTAGSAAILLMISAVASGLLGLLRTKVVISLWGAGMEQDAYQAAFGLPDLISYFLIGGAASISVITILNRYRETSDAEGEDRALSVIFSTMFVVLAAGVVLGEIIAPGYVWLFNEGFRTDPGRFHLCVSLTRWMLPAQLFFFAGSVMSSRLQVRKIFIYQAFTPVIYNTGIILGAIFLHRQLGVHSLAIGVLAGSLVGAALLNSYAALRSGLRYRLTVGFADPIFREWLRLSLPLMVGVTLVMADRYILGYFASVHEGGITFITVAKFLFNAPFSVIGPAAGAASLPFFASMFQQRRMAEFSTSVSRAVSRLFSVGMIVSAWMVALAPWMMDLFRGGRFHGSDAAATTRLFMVLAVTLAIWAVQGIYARAFYAASDTMTPAITGTVITVASVPIYYALFHRFDLTGLAIASDLGILIQTASLAILLHRKRLVSFADLEFGELARALAAALVSFAVVTFVTRFLPPVSTHLRDLETIAAASAVWAAVAALTLLATGSELPKQILRRR